MLYRFIKNKVKWVIKKQKQYCNIINIILIVLLLVVLFI